MTDQPLTAIPRAAQVPAIPARLEPDAIGVAQDTIIGLASSAPAATMAVALAALAAKAAYGGGPVIMLCGIPMLILANTYRRLNLWNANCGASFEWVGRAINPYLGFLVGWLMLAGCLTGTISVVVVLSPAVLAVFGASAGSSLAEHLAQHGGHHGHGRHRGGRHPHHRAHPGRHGGDRVRDPHRLLRLGLLEVLGHHHGTFPITKGWLSLSGINGKGNLAAGLLIAVFMYTGWDATVYVNEEVKHRRRQPGPGRRLRGRAAGRLVRPPAGGHAGRGVAGQLQANSSSALVYIAQVLGGGGWAKVMAFALALSVIASTGTGIVITARIAYGMASHRVLPPVLGNVSRRYATPAIGTVIIGADPHRGHLGVPAVQLDRDRLHRRGQRDRLAVRRFLHAHRARRGHVLPAPHLQQHLGRGARRHPSAGRRRVPGLGGGQVAANAPASQRWSLIGIIGAGLVLMLVARFILRSPFFRIPRESAAREH